MSESRLPSLRVTIVIEYPADPEHYPDCDGDPVRMAAYDQASFDEGALDVVDIGEWKSVVIEPVELSLPAPPPPAGEGNADG